MSFPEFDVPQNTGHDQDNFDGIQVENMNSNAGQDFNFHSQAQPSHDAFYNMPNNPEAHWGNQNADLFAVVDEEEEKRIQARKQEEDERRSKIISLMNEEIRVKQEYRDKAREYLENFSEIRGTTQKKRSQFNKQNEVDFLQNRQSVKEGKKNPWERVVENIEIKESDYKGTKDVSRMRSVILVRKGDMMKMK